MLSVLQWEAVIRKALFENLNVLKSFMIRTLNDVLRAWRVMAILYEKIDIYSLFVPFCAR